MLRLASRRNSRLWLTQFAKWLPQHGGCTLRGRGCHAGGDHNVRPSRARAEHAKRCEPICGWKPIMRGPWGARPGSAPSASTQSGWAWPSPTFV